MPNLTGSEFSYINWLRRRIPPNPRVLIGPGDDAAVLRPSADRPLLITTDMLLQGSCFLLEQAGARAVGRKALAVNLSDIAAMAGVPIAAVVSLGLPRTGGREVAEQLFEGIREIADAFAVPIVGGDTNSWHGELVISITVIGEATERGPVCRNGARPDDWIFVTGPLGGSIRGKHLDFTPRVREALALHQLVDLHSMIDISDGLSADLHHLCEESGCGAILRAEAIPIAPAAHELAVETGKTPLEHARSDGEDFELIFTVAPEDGRKLLESQPIAGITLSHIGEMTASGFVMENKGTLIPLSPRGYVHALE